MSYTFPTTNLKTLSVPELTPYPKPWHIWLTKTSFWLLDLLASYSWSKHTKYKLIFLEQGVTHCEYKKLLCWLSSEGESGRVGATFSPLPRDLVLCSQSPSLVPLHDRHVEKGEFYQMMRTGTEFTWPIKGSERQTSSDDPATCNWRLSRTLSFMLPSLTLTPSRCHSVALENWQKGWI